MIIFNCDNCNQERSYRTVRGGGERELIISSSFGLFSQQVCLISVKFDNAKVPLSRQTRVLANKILGFQDIFFLQKFLKILVGLDGQIGAKRHKENN